jgi:hypothetical protein
MSCGGGHLGFPISIKNKNFVEDFPMIIPGQFGFNCTTTNMIKAKLYMNVHWMVLYKLYVFCSDMKLKMAAMAGLSLALDPMGKMFENASSLKPLGQLKPNCPEMIIGRSSTKFLFSMPIGNPRWLPLQVIVLTQDHMGKMQKYVLL